MIWDTGDDYLTREPGQVPGTGTSRLALEEQIAVRDYLNEGGKVVYAGKHAGQQYVEGFEFRNYGFPQPNEDKQGRWCDADLPEAGTAASPHTDDFLQYYLGAYLRVENGNSWNADGHGVPGHRRGPVRAGDAGRSANHGRRSGRRRADVDVRRDELDDRHARRTRTRAVWPAGTGRARARSRRSRASYYMASGHDDEAYKRL